MTIPQVVDGVTDADAAFMNQLVDAANQANAAFNGAGQITTAAITPALGAYEPLRDMQAAYKTAAYYGIPLDGLTPAGAAINTAIEDINTGNMGGGGALHMLPVRYLCEEKISVPPRFRLLGDSASAEGLYGGTVFVAADGLNDDIIATTGDWWHWGELAYFAIEGNKESNTTGSGIVAGLMGEASTIHNVQVLRCAEHGVVIAGESTPSSLIDVSVMRNGKSGIYLDGVTRHINLINPSGDANGDSLITVAGSGNAGVAGFVNIIGIKSESFVNSSEHEPAVLIDNYGGNVNFLGGTIEGNPSNQLVAIQRSGSVGGQVWFQGVRVAHYATQFKDDIAPTNTIALGVGATQTLSGLVGKTGFDISTGRHFSGRDAVTPTPTAYGNAGSGATASVGAGTDVRGTLTLTTGTGCSSGDVCRITFGAAYVTSPRLMLFPANAAAATVADTVYVTISDGAKIDIAVSSALNDSTAYQWHYVVMG